jgi:hypothetical protein
VALGDFPHPTGLGFWIETTKLHKIYLPFFLQLLIGYYAVHYEFQQLLLGIVAMNEVMQPNSGT